MEFQMAKKENLPKFDINGKTYEEKDLTDKQKILINHVMDIDRKINQLKFNLDQMNVGREAFMQLLSQDLAEQTEE